MFESEEFPGSMESDVCAFVDPRTRSNGVRVLCAEESFEPEDNVSILTDPTQYNVARMVHGLPESSHEWGGHFPLHLHLQHLHGVSFEKGCYIGQELTQRTHFTGAIRKIALPFLVVSDADIKIEVQNFSPAGYVDTGFNLPLLGEEIQDAKSRKLGKVIAATANMGIALVDLNRLNKNGPNHEYRVLNDFRTYLWQPVWLDVALQGPLEEEGAEPEEQELIVEQGRNDPNGRPPGM